MKHLRKAADELAAADRVIQGFDRLRSPKNRAGAPQCYVAEVMYNLKFDELWSKPVLKDDEKMRCTDFDGVLPRAWPEKRPVCQFVYEFTRAHGRLPTKLEMEARIEKSVIKVRAS